MKKNLYLCLVVFPLLSFSQILNHQNAISGGAERHLQFKVTDTPNDVMEIGNSTSQNNQFQPSIWIHKESSPGPVMVFAGHITSAVDFGTVPIINLVAGKVIFDNYAPYSSQFPWGEGGTTQPILNRPIFAVSNAYVNYLSVAANGNFGIGTTTPLSKLHNVGTVRFQNLPIAPMRGTCAVVMNYATGELFADCASIGGNLAGNPKPIVNALKTVQGVDAFESVEAGKKLAFITAESLAKSNLSPDKGDAQLIPYLLESIKELSAKIEALQHQLNTRNENMSENIDVKVFPNPVDDYFNLYFEKADHSSMTLKVYDASGKILLTKTEIPKNEKIILNVSNFNSGVYYYEVSSVGKSPLKKGKFIKN